MWTPLPRPKEARKAAKAKTKKRTKKFDVNCFWCGAYGQDGELSKESYWETADSQVPTRPDPKGKGKGGKSKKGASSLDEWPDGQEYHTSGEKANEEAAVSHRCRHERHNREYWHAWKKIQRQAQRQWKAYKNGGPGANAADAEMAERIDPTIDSCCAAGALPVGVASAVGMQELNRSPQEYIATNAEKIRELGFKTPTLKFQNGGSVQSRRSRQSDRAAASKPRWFFQ